MERGRTFGWLLRNSRGHRWQIALACLSGIARVGAGLAFVWVSKLLIDTATGGEDREGLFSQSVILALLMLAEMLISIGGSYITSRTEINMKNSMRERIYDNLLGSRWDKAGDMHSGDLLNRLTEDVRVLTDVICSKLPSLIVMLFQLAAAFLMLYLMSWKLAVCVIGIMPFFLLISKVYVRKTRHQTAEIRKFDSKTQSNMQEGLQHHVVVQTLECEELMSSRLANLQSSLYDWTMRRTRFGLFSRSMVRMGFIICYLTAFLWSAWHLHSGEITYGMMTAFLQLVARIQNPMVNMSHLVPAFVQAISSVDRLRELELLPAEEKTEPVRLQAPAGIRMTDVSFRYSDTAANVFNRFSYDFKPGSKTVLMGETGVGKSTLVRLLLALQRPQQGHINIYNSEREAEVSPSTRCNMVYVPQGNSLLEGTIRENLLFADSEATEKQIKEALHTAAADFVYELPAGLDTPCGELGNGLSEGQAQRIAIARALLRKGSILLLDEFNSSLDETTARTLLQRLLKRHPESTIIFISHRPEVLEHCNGEKLLLKKERRKPERGK